MKSDLLATLIAIIISCWMLIDYFHILSTIQQSDPACFKEQRHDTTTLCSFLTACTRLTGTLHSTSHDCGATIPRPPNLYLDLETAANMRSTDLVPPYPQIAHRAISARVCEEWFYSSEASARLREYMDRGIPTSGVSSRVTYTGGGAHDGGQLIIYVCASLNSSYRQEITSFNLRRLRAAFDSRVFIIVVEVSPNSAVHDSADVTMYADFTSPETFYDAAALQEGVLEAFRLFGSRLANFSGLLLINDSILGPLTTDLGVAPYLYDGPVLIGFAVWERHWVSGSGLFFNRAAFETKAFSDYWRFVRSPCGKWGAMLLFEMSLVRYLMDAIGMRCLTFSNDIYSLQDVPASTWKDKPTTPFFKHKQSDGEAAVLDFIRQFRQGSAGPLESCRV